MKIHRFIANIIGLLSAAAAITTLIGWPRSLNATDGVYWLQYHGRQQHFAQGWTWITLFSRPHTLHLSCHRPSGRFMPAVYPDGLQVLAGRPHGTIGPIVQPRDVLGFGLTKGRDLVDVRVPFWFVAVLFLGVSYASLRRGMFRRRRGAAQGFTVGRTKGSGVIE